MSNQGQTESQFNVGISNHNHLNNWLEIKRIVNISDSESQSIEQDNFNALICSFHIIIINKLAV